MVKDRGVMGAGGAADRDTRPTGSDR